MTLGDFANLSTIVQAFLVIISLGFIWYQLRESAKLAKAANVQSLTEQAAAFNSLLFESEKLSQLWYSFGQNLDTAVDRLRYRDMMVQWLIFHQNIYYQRQQGLLDHEIYESWLQDLKFTLQHHNVDVITEDLHKFFPGSFGDHLRELKYTATQIEHAP